MSIQFKYSKNLIDLIYGIIYISLGIVHFILLMALYFNLSLNVLFTSLLLVNIIGCFLISIMYFRMYFGKRSYLTIKNHILYMDQGLIRKNKEIGFSNIKSVCIVGNKFRVALISGSEVKINLHRLSIQDIDKLEETLDKYHLILT